MVTVTAATTGIHLQERVPVALNKATTMAPVETPSTQNLSNFNFFFLTNYDRNKASETVELWSQ